MGLLFVLTAHINLFDTGQPVNTLKLAERLDDGY
jgi:hypothetical protein